MQPAPGWTTPAPASRATLGSRLSQRPWPSVGVAIVFVVVSLWAASATRAGDETCEPIAVTWYSPSGIAGCTLDGPTAGTASWYGGDQAAANWCTWPWTDCGSVRVVSHATGVAITVAVAMFGDLYTGTPDERLLDLTHGQVLALGLDPADGTFAVTVTPVDAATGIEQVGSPRLVDEFAGGSAPAEDADPAVGVGPPTVLPDTALRP